MWDFVIFLDKSSSNPSVCSPTAFELPSPDVINSIFFFTKYSQSIFSVPEPTLATNFKLTALSIRSLSIFILLLRTSP